jgi:two-component system chemotaxis response regulator CheY
VKKILTVDDSLTIRMVIRRTLTQAGYEVLEAANGEEALKIIENTELNLIISDFNMPVMDGLELMKRVKTGAPYKLNRFTPFVMLTAVMAESLKKQATEMGALAYLVKPFRPEQVLEMVAKLVP